MNSSFVLIGIKFPSNFTAELSTKYRNDYRYEIWFIAFHVQSASLAERFIFTTFVYDDKSYMDSHEFLTALIR